MNPQRVTDKASWNALAASLPGAHILQSWEWGEFKSRYGWSAQRFVWEKDGQPVAAAQVLTRSAARGLVRVMYAPKGPLLDWADASLRAQILGDLESLARREHTVFIKIDPDVAVSTPHPQPLSPQGRGARGEGQIEDVLEQRGWNFSPDQIQFRNTVVLDLRPREDQILAGMKQKTRYNVRLAEKRVVRVRPGSLSDLGLLYRLYAETSVRDGFVIRAPEYYRDAWGSFIQAGLAQPLIAEIEGQPVGALILFVFAKTAWYMYGMSREAHREKMPNHLLQWEAMRWAKAHGCETYDLWGAPDEFVESDPLWGVWKFKEGFGGQVARHIGAWDFAPARMPYWLYTSLMPRVLDVMRWRGRRQTRATLD